MSGQGDRKGARRLRAMRKEPTMKIISNFGLLAGALFVLLLSPLQVSAAPDQYVGDTAIYGGSSGGYQPNVLIILDNSGSMNDAVLPGSPYVPATVYPLSNACAGAACQTDTVYKCTAFGLECGNWTQTVASVNTVATSCPAPSSANPKNSLLTTGQWNSGFRRLQTSGACVTGGGGIYALGNWINWRQQTGSPRPKIDVAKEVITNLISSTTDIRFGVMVFNNNQGGTFLTYNGYNTQVKDMDAIFSGTTTNRQALINAVNSVTANSWTPLAETLFEAMRYYQGGPSAFNSIPNYVSPIEASCQKNYVVLVTDGMSTQDSDNVLLTICSNGDCDGDGFEPANDPAKTYSNQGSDYLDDVAKYMYTTDLSPGFIGTQNVTTYTVGFGLGGANAGAVKLLNETALNGGGQAFMTNNQQELANALTQILGLVIEVDTSFVAPVVPVSPENRTYSGSRVYLGFFKPQAASGFWYGNLKKYGINSAGVVVDKNGVPATNPDGSFKAAATSYWSTAADGGLVDDGGAGDVLLNRDFATSPRKIYTYMGTSTNLTAPSNAFTTTNAAITPATLAAADATEKDKLINFVHGLDSYDANLNGVATEKREWIVGDILHSKPLVISYSTYSFSATSEADCNVNKSTIYVGSNDGMMHAFKDCDGSEAWAFIPQDLLQNLKYLPQVTHSYFVDGPPLAYVYDGNKDGNIDPASGDRAILLFGERRGGGFYYALDVSDPATPTYLWRLSSTESPSGVATDYAELAETFSDPEMAKVKVGTTDKVVMVIGAGYDNANEDGRYGATQTFTGTGMASGTGDGVVTSTGTSAPLNPKGRGIYVIEVATLNSSGVPSFTNSGRKVWGYTNANNSNLTFSIPSSISIFDKDFNGYADRLYVGDMGGNLWRFDVSNTDTTQWTGAKIFSSSPGVGGTSDVGRKIFYRPSVTQESGYQMLFFGTGDREHPLNRAVLDRLYSVKDRNETGITVVEDSIDNLHELADMTLDRLQASTSSAEIATILSDLDTKYGWFILLDQNPGEKVLAPVLAFKDVYYTTYAPNTTSPDPCVSGNLGTARVYIVNYKTGEAVFNFDTSNDSTTTTNARAKNAAGKVLLRSDRVETLGSGIPSGVVLVLTSGGDVVALVGCGGALCTPPPPLTTTTVPLYWRKLL